MTRVSENQISGLLLNQIASSRQQVARYSGEVSSGLKVTDPGDSRFAGTISEFREQLTRIDGFQSRIKTVQGALSVQDSVLDQANQAIVRGKELATQGANETLSSTQRAQMAVEVFQLRDHLVNLANTTYQGKYIYGGTDTDTPPYSASTYTNFTSTAASQRYTYNNNAGAANTRTVDVTDDLSMAVGTPGNGVFDNAIQSLERLGRALEGFETLPAVGAPDGTGVAYVFPTDRTAQTDAIRAALDQLETARSGDVLPETINVAGRMNRLQSAARVLDDTKTSAQEVLSRLQDADVTEAATGLQQAQTALEASLTVTARILKLSILDYI